MTLKIQGQRYLSVKIGPYRDEDFIRHVDELLLVEETGGKLPTFLFRFQTDRQEVAAYLNEGNVIKFGLGETEQNKIETEMVIQTTRRSSASQFLNFTVHGVLNKLAYLKETDVVVYKADKGESTVSLIKKIASRWFKFDTNITTNKSDKNTYPQAKYTHKALLSQMALRVDLRPSFAMTSVTLDNYYRLIDIDKAMKQVKYKIAIDSKDEGELIAEGSPILEDISGLNNKEGSSGVTQYVQDLDIGETSKANTEITPKFGSSQFMPFSGQVKKQMPQNVPGTEDVPSKSLSTRLHNKLKIQSISHYSLTIRLAAKYPRIKPLDVVTWREPSNRLDGKNNAETLGKWLVHKVVYALNGDMFSLSLVLIRDTLNNIKGDNLGFSVSFLNFLKSILSFIGAGFSKGFDFDFLLTSKQKALVIKILESFKKRPELLDKLRNSPTGFSTSTYGGTDELIGYNVVKGVDSLVSVSDFGLEKFVSPAVLAASSNLTLQDLGLDVVDLPKGSSFIFEDSSLTKEELINMDINKVMEKITENELGPVTLVEYPFAELVQSEIVPGLGLSSEFSKIISSYGNSIIKPIVWDSLQKPMISDNLHSLSTVEECENSTITVIVEDLSFDETNYPPRMDVKLSLKTDFLKDRHTQIREYSVFLKPFNGEYPETFLEAPYIAEGLAEVVKIATPSLLEELDIFNAC